MTVEDANPKIVEISTGLVYIRPTMGEFYQDIQELVREYLQWA
jgi:hypothetical protein